MAMMYSPSILPHNNNYDDDDDDGHEDGHVELMNDEEELPTEAQLVLLCLDHLRDLRRSYSSKSELLHSEGLDADYLSVAIYALSRCFVKPSELQHSSQDGNDAKMHRPTANALQPDGGVDIFPVQDPKSSKNFISIPNLNSINQEIFYSKNPNTLPNGSGLSTQDYYEGDEDIDSHYQQQSHSQYSNDENNNYRNSTTARNEEDRPLDWHVHDDLHPSNVHRFYLLDGLASSSSSSGGGQPLTLGELTVAGLVGLGARSRAAAEQDVRESALFGQFVQAVRSKGFFRHPETEKPRQDPDEERERQRVAASIEEERLQKVMGKVRAKLATKAQEQLEGGLDIMDDEDGNGGGGPPPLYHDDFVMTAAERLERRRRLHLQQARHGFRKHGGSSNSNEGAMVRLQSKQQSQDVSSIGASSSSSSYRKRQPPSNSARSVSPKPTLSSSPIRAHSRSRSPALAPSEEMRSESMSPPPTMHDNLAVATNPTVNHHARSTQSLSAHRKMMVRSPPPGPQQQQQQVEESSTMSTRDTPRSSTARSRASTAGSLGSLASPANTTQDYPPPQQQQRQHRQHQTPTSRTKRETPRSTRSLASTRSLGSLASPSTVQDNPADIEEAERLKGVGNTHMQRKEYVDATEAYTAALTLSPSGPYTHVYYSNRAAALLSMKRFDEAIVDSERSLALKPDYGKAHARLGLAHFLLGNYRLAVEAYTVSLKYEPDNKSTKNYLEKAAKRAAAQDLSAGVTASNAAITPSFSFVSEVERADVAAARHSRSNPGIRMPDDTKERKQHVREKDAEKLKLRGNSCMANRDYEAALQNYSAAIKLSPDGPNSHVYFSNRAAALCYLERYEEAEADSHHSLSLFPEYGKAHARLGLSRFFMGDYEGAIEAYTAALTYDPENAASKSYLSKARARLAKQREGHQHSKPSSRSAKKSEEGLATTSTKSSSGRRLPNRKGGSKDSLDEIMNSTLTQKTVAEI